MSLEKAAQFSLCRMQRYYL